MKIIITLSTLAMVTILGMAAYNYIGPEDERLPPGTNPKTDTLGFYARSADAVAVLDVIGVSDTHPDSGFGCVTGRVVNALHGCTNGQELVILKVSVGADSPIETGYDPNFEYFPTNNSRIVCAIITRNPPHLLPTWTPKVWKQPPVPSTNIISQASLPFLWGDARSWWYDGYQDNLPLVHLTNLLYSAQVECNWTNFYHKVRDAIPAPVSPRVWQDAFCDMSELLLRATQTQFDYIMNDPLLPAECQDRVQDFHIRFQRKREDE
jgi:hypothetical protein